MGSALTIWHLGTSGQFLVACPAERQGYQIPRTKGGGPNEINPMAPTGEDDVGRRLELSGWPSGFWLTSMYPVEWYAAWIGDFMTKPVVAALIVGSHAYNSHLLPASNPTHIYTCFIVIVMSFECSMRSFTNSCGWKLKWQGDIVHVETWKKHRVRAMTCSQSVSVNMSQFSQSIITCSLMSVLSGNSTSQVESATTSASAELHRWRPGTGSPSWALHTERILAKESSSCQSVTDFVTCS